MENKDLQILADISELASSLRCQLEELEKMIDRLKSANAEGSDYQYDEDAPIDIELDDFSDYGQGDVVVESVAEESEPEPAFEPEPEHKVEPTFEPEVESEPEADVEPTFESEVESEPEPEVDSEPVAEELVVEVEVEPVPEESESKIEFEPELVLESVAEPESEPLLTSAPVRQAVIDVLEDRRAWKTDMPGAPVRDIRSAISLNDRVLFINRLFKEDPMAFQEMLSKINNMTTLEEVVETVVSAYPDWDLGSELVYRFMMAVRRKVR